MFEMGNKQRRKKRGLKKLYKNKMSNFQKLLKQAELRLGTSNEDAGAAGPSFSSEPLVTAPAPEKPENLQLSEDQTKNLIQLYKNEEVLWWKDHPAYDDRSMRAEAMRAEAWERIAVGMDVPGLGARQARSLINIYKRLYRRTMDRPDQTAEFVFWRNQMDFLKQYMNPDDEDESEPESEDLGNIVYEIKEEVYSEHEEEADALADAECEPDFNEEVNRLVDEDLEMEELGENRLNAYRVHPVPNFRETRSKATQTKESCLFVKKQLRVKKQSLNDISEELGEVKKDITKRLTVIAKSQKQMIEVLESRVKPEDMFDTFGRFVSGALREMGTYGALALQTRIVELVHAEQAKRKTVTEATRAPAHTQTK